MGGGGIHIICYFAAYDEKNISDQKSRIAPLKQYENARSQVKIQNLSILGQVPAFPAFPAIRPRRLHMPMPT